MKLHKTGIALSSVAAAMMLSGCDLDKSDQKTEDVSKLTIDFNSSPRVVTNLNLGWNYQMAYSDPDAIASDYDDSGDRWGSVTLPHSVDADRITNYDPTDPPYKGISTYRKKLSLAKAPGRRQYLEFDGAAMITKVFVNGQEAGEHVGGFSRFRIDITDFAVDGDNTVVIQIDNRSYTPGVHDQAFLPMETGQDWIYYGGLYRDVKLVEVGEVGLDAEDYGSAGIYFLQKETTNESSDIYANIRVRNKSEGKFNGSVVTIIKDAEGTIVYSALAPITVEDKQVKVLESNFTLNDIHLWDGVNDPYLYEVYVQVLDDQQKVIDQVEQPLGLRYYEFDAQRGFLLNGKPYQLKGVAMHQDRDVVGWSSTKEMREADLDTIRDMGVNSVRFSLYPHNIDTGEYSNKVGLLNYIELPIANSYLNETDHGEFGAQYLESAKEQMRELVRQNFNFPSMGVVGNSNEVGLDPNPDNPAKTAWLQSLSDVIKEEFGERFGQHVPYRKTTLATVSTDVIGDPDWDTAEMPCHNVYLGWYNSTIESAPSFMDSMKAAYPDIPFCLSEYGAGVSNKPEFASENPVMGDHSSQWGTMFHEGYLKAITEREWIWGTYVWVMYDFAVSTRNEGDTIGRNDKGLVRFDHTTKKDQYFLYQANWSEAPMVHIVDKSLEQAVSRQVKVYSTLDELTLRINGKLVGSKLRGEYDSLLPGVFVWTSEENDAFFNTGEENMIVVSGAEGNTVYSDDFKRFAKEYAGTTIYSTQLAVTTSDEGVTFKGIISHLPDDLTFERLKDAVHLDLGATWGSASNVAAPLTDGDTFEVIAGNGLTRLYTVRQSNSLATYRKVHSTMGYFIPGSSQAVEYMLDGDESTTPVAIVGSAPDKVASTVNIDLGSVYYVNTVLPTRNSGLSQEAITFNVKGDVLGTDKAAYTDDIQWIDEPVTLNGGAQGMRYVELEINATDWSTGWPGADYPLAGFSEIHIFGGLIKSESLELNYQTKTIGLKDSVTSLAELQQALISVDSMGVVDDPVSLQFLAADGTEVTELIEVMNVKVTQTRGAQQFSEVYSLQR